VIEELIELIPLWSTLSGIILAIIFWFHSLNYIRKEMPRSPKNRCRIAAIFASIGIIVAILAHEAGHAFVASSCGIKVTSIGLFPLGGFTQFEISPTEMNPLSEIAISVAGPLVNLLIGIAALIPVKIFGESIAENTIQYISYMSIKLGVWNIIPIFIFLDGGRMVEGIARCLFGESIVTTVFTIVIIVLSMALWIEYKKHFDNLLEKLRKL